ncbi:MAG TPA: AsmA family protein [Nitrospirales bacterium]|nr:AsmA family protein [Nitrospirales bacterium]
MFRPSRKFWISLVLIFGVCGVLAYELFPFIKTDVYRETLEMGFSASLGRKVSLEGPLSLTFSSQPHLILEHVSVSNPPWTSQPHLFRADRVEIGLSLWPLLQRRLEVEKIALEGAKLLLEEGSEGLDNWTLQEDSRPGFLSRAVPSVFMTISERGEIIIERSQIQYRSYPAEDTTEVSIHRAVVIAPDDQYRKFSFEGTYHDSPVNIELIGGRIMDLFTLTEPWPVDGVLSTTGAFAAIKGRVGGANSDQMFALQIQVNGDRLSALNDLLKIGLPDSAPFMIAANVVKTPDVLNLSDIHGTLGASDVAGQLRVQNEDGRQKMSGRLTSNAVQLHDLTSLAHHHGSKPAPSLEDTASVSPASPPVEVDLDVTVAKLLFGETDLGSLSFTAGIREGLVLLDPIHIKSFGGTGNARLTFDYKPSQAQSTLQAKVRSLNYGSALRALGGAMNIEGSTDFDLTASGSGVLLPELFKSLTVNLQNRRTTFGFSDPMPEAKTSVVLREGSLRVTKGGPVTMVAQGTYRERAVHLKLATTSLIELATPETTWPLSLTARGGGAFLEAKGFLQTGGPDLDGALTVALNGRRLSELDPDLPPVGPYALRAQVIKKGDRYEVSDFRSRFGNSDFSGILEMNFQKARPYLTGIFTSKHIEWTELSGPENEGESAIPSEGMRAIDVDLNMVINHVRNGRLNVAGLTFTAGLQAGRLKVESVQGTVLDQQSAYGNFHGGFQLDTTRPIPTISGNVSLDHVRYEHLFPEAGFVDLAENVVNLNAEFSGAGHTISDMLNHSTVRVDGEKLSVRFHREADHPASVQVMANLKVETVDGGPLRLYVEGVFDTTSFRLRSSTGSMMGLMKDRGLWPMNVRLDLPEAVVEVSGHLTLPHPAQEFTLQVLVKGNNLRDLNFLTAASLPDAGPLDITGLVTRSPVGYHVTDLKGVLAGSDVQGHVMVLTKGIRPRVRGKLTANNLVLGAVKQPLDDSSAQQKRSTLKAFGDEVRGIGSSAVNVVRDTIGMRKDSGALPLKSIPDWVFPIEDLRAIDLMLDAEIKHIRRAEEDLGHASFQIALEEGLLTLHPLTGNLWGGDFEGKFVLDGTKYVPTLDVELHIHGLNYGRVARYFGGSDLVKGKSQSILLALQGRGDTLHEVLEQASGRFELVDGPLELATKYIDLWAADLITTALTTAWKSESVTKLNCTVGYFDIEEGVVKSDDILIDSHRLTIAGIGKLNLADETLDIVLTPRPKDPSLFSLAHTVRITGPLSNPNVSSDKLRIAESGGWGLLGLVTPMGWVIAIPQIAGTTVGTMNQNPCVEALKGRPQTAQALDEIKGGLWGKIKRAFSNLAGFSETPSANPQ